MHRTFATTTRRKQTYLDGLWDFAPDPDDRGMSEEWYSRFPTDAASLHVPGVWNTALGLLDYEGVGWYRRRFSIGACTAAALHFAAVTQQANIWLDGEPVGEHYGGFLPFSFVIPEPAPGEHELVVRVDSTHDMTTTIPAANVDWFHNGGIARPVWVEDLFGPGYISSLRVMPVVTNGRCTLRVRAELMNLTLATVNDTWTFFFEGKAIRSEHVSLGPCDCQVILFAAEVDAQLWSPQNPRLYTAQLVFGNDDLIERTGFRAIQVSGDRVLLNGEPLRLRGVNRQQDHPDWGLALPLDAMTRDLDLLTDLGANAVRGAHCPNDQRFLDLCDERGLLFLEEIPLRGYTAEQLSLDIIADRASAMMWAMIERDVNHPCIWAWGALSNCATDAAEGRAVVERLVDVAHEADPTRPVTYVSDKGLSDICMDLADIVSLSIVGWRLSDPDWLTILDQARTHIGDTPLLIAECCVGAPSEMMGQDQGRQLVREAVRLLDERSDLVGYYFWQFCDTRINPSRFPERLRGYDESGLFTERRLPKLICETVRALWRD